MAHSPDAVPPTSEQAPPAVDHDVEADGDDEVDELPGHAGTVVVPLANPDTAADLLAIAIAFCEHAGEVIAVTISVDDAQAEADAQVNDTLAEIVDEANHDHPATTIELVSRSATSIGRGIVELAREENADLIVLGVPAPGPATGRESGPPIGRIGEAVVDVAPCDVVVMRPGLDGEHVSDLRKLVVAVDGGESSRTAMRSGIVLGEGLGLSVDAVHVSDTGRPRWEGLSVLARSLDGVDGRDRVRTRLLRGADIGKVVSAASEVTDLVVVGLQRESGFRQWLFGSTVNTLLHEAEGPVLLVARQAVGVGMVGRLEQLAGWVRPGLTDVERETLLWTARRQATTTIDYVTLLAVSAVLATLGLVQDSVAVIIGAMLVAPLLGPLSAMSIGLVTARVTLLRRGTITLTVGTLAAMAVSLAVGAVLPLATPTEQMLLRGEPSLLDVGVAMASGLVGAFATARKDIPAALAGVAIAAALVPPLCTVGLGVALGDGGLALGALLLYFVNIASVVVTGAIAMAWFGMRPVEQDHATRRRITSGAVAAGLLFVVVTTAVGLLQSQREERTVIVELRDELDVADGVDLVELEVTEAEDGPGAVVFATVRADRDLTDDELRDAEDRMTAELGRPVDLRVVVLRVVEAPD